MSSLDEILVGYKNVNFIKTSSNVIMIPQMPISKYLVIYK